MTTIIPAAIVLMMMSNTPGSSAGSAAPQQWRAEVISKPGEEEAALASLLRSLTTQTQAESQWTQVSRTVFVVPGPDLAAENFMQITEDMAVMCRILDRAVAPVALSSSFSGRGFDGGSQAQGLYLDGYGALFFIEAGFPLVRPAQEQERPQAEQSGDALWSQTVYELKGVPPKQSGARLPPYDAQRVENLKNALIKSLRHSANLRLHGSQDRISVVVTTRCQSNSYDYIYRGTGRRSTVWTQQPAGTPSDALVLGTTKPDVDAFAKGDLTLEQFTEKVKILASWTSGLEQASPSTTIVLPSSGMATGVER